MNNTVIKVENLSKRYIIRHQSKERYTALRDVITKSITNISRKHFPPFRSDNSFFKDQTHEEFWALKNISFEVKQGDRIGIIGRNGAGKSTLLKLLSRITEPSSGRFEITGRVASLLEVGTGFHPELTGRENIFLNGAILGMSRAEIKKNFDEIVDFAEIEKFLDTPVKRYSSGMYVRLAFAVAAHIEPDILIVDEVLAVGDAQFQKKCLGKMNSVAEEGRTVLFVSHNMSIIQALCSKCLVIKNGKLAALKPSAEAVQIYIENTSASNSFERPRQTSGNPTLISGQLSKTNEFEIKIDVHIFSQTRKNISLDIRLSDYAGNSVGFGSLGSLKPNQLIKLKSEINKVSFVFSTKLLAIGTYFISLDLSLPDIEYLDRANNCFSFDIHRPPENNAIRVVSQAWGYGCLEIPLHQI